MGAVSATPPHDLTSTTNTHRSQHRYALHLLIGIPSRKKRYSLARIDHAARGQSLHNSGTPWRNKATKKNSCDDGFRLPQRLEPRNLPRPTSEGLLMSWDVVHRRGGAASPGYSVFSN